MDGTDIPVKKSARTTMLKIIDAYILNRFFRLLTFMLLAGIAIFLSVDLIEHLDQFIDREVSWGYIIKYYIYFIPYIIYLIIPVMMLLTTLFSLGSMSSANEIIALKASGVSIYRILLVVAIPALFISGLTFSFGESIVPYFNRQRMDIYRHQVKKIPKSSATRRGRIYLIDNENRLVHIGHFNGETMSAFNANILTVDKRDILSRVDTKRMVYKKDHWILYDAVVREFVGDSVKVSKIPAYEWRELGFKPEDLMKIQSKPEEMNYWQLKEFVQKQVSTGANALRWKVDLKDKIANPFAAFIIVIFGVPIAVTKRRSGLMVGFGISLLVCFLYFGVIQSGKVLGYKGLVDPVFAAWGGHVIFGIVGIISVLTARK